MIVSSGDLYVIGLPLIRLRKAALETLASEDCAPPPKSLARAVMMCADAFRKHPNLLFQDGTAAREFEAYAAYRRLNGETFTLLGDPKEPRKAASIRCYDPDDTLQREWIYQNLDKAWFSLRQWQPDREDRPTGWVRAYRRSRTTHLMVPCEMALTAT